MELINITQFINKNDSAYTQTCYETIQKCKDECFKARLDIGSVLSDRFYIAIVVYFLLILTRMFIHKIIKNEEILRQVYIRLDLVILILTLFLICVLWIF